jgi:predicted flap endonuclease-1-like 5' DNA nuclease
MCYAALHNRRAIHVEQNAMALFPAFDTDLADFNAESALRLPLGAASPLWLAFASAAGAGVADWWMTRWTGAAAFDWSAPRDAEAPAAERTTLPVVSQPTIETPVEAALEPIEAASDAIVETAAALVEPANEIAEQAAAEVVSAADDLTRLVGVGPRLAARLGELGVNSFEEIAAWTDEDLAAFDKALDLKGRAARDAWVAQARRFAEG